MFQKLLALRKAGDQGSGGSGLLGQGELKMRPKTLQLDVNLEGNP
jgi:hypothetical protein